jgi:hypothetical protein
VKQITTAKTRRVEIASPELGTTRTFLDGSPLYTRQARTR